MFQRSLVLQQRSTGTIDANGLRVVEQLFAPTNPNGAQFASVFQNCVNEARRKGRGFPLQHHRVLVPPVGSRPANHPHVGTTS